MQFGEITILMSIFDSILALLDWLRTSFMASFLLGKNHQ